MERSRQGEGMGKKSRQTKIKIWMFLCFGLICMTVLADLVQAAEYPETEDPSGQEPAVSTEQSESMDQQWEETMDPKHLDLSRHGLVSGVLAEICRKFRYICNSNHFNEYFCIWNRRRC